MSPEQRIRLIIYESETLFWIIYIWASQLLIINFRIILLATRTCLTDDFQIIPVNLAKNIHKENASSSNVVALTILRKMGRKMLKGILMYKITGQYS